MSVEEHMQWARARVERLLAQGPEERVVAVLVISVDSVLAVDGRSAGLSSDADRALVGAWREAADALLVGTPTLSAEVYGGGLFPPQTRARRLRRGVAAMPPVVTLDRSGSLDLERATRAREPLELIVYTPRGSARDDPRATWIELANATLANVVADLRRRFGHGLIVAEPGPQLLTALRNERVLTDLSVTIAPLLANAGPRLPPAEQAAPTRAVAIETVEEAIFVHFLTEPD